MSLVDATNPQEQQDELRRQMKIAPPNLQPTTPQYAPVTVQTPQAPPVDPHIQAAQAKLDADKAKPAGIAHYIPITQGDGFGHKLLRGLEHVGRGVANVGETALDIAAPGVMANIPGTLMGHAAQVGRDTTNLGQAQDTAQKNVEIAKYNQELSNAQHAPVALNKGHNPQTDNDEYFYMDSNKPVFPGVEVPGNEKPVKPADRAVGMDYTRYNSMVDQALPDLTAEQRKAYYVDQTTPESVAEKRMANARAQAGLAAKPGNDLKTDTKEVVGADGVKHQILYNTQTGATIKDLGPAEVAQGQAMTKFGIAPGDTYDQALAKIQALDPTEAAALEKVHKYQGGIESYPANPRKGAGGISQQEALGILGLDPSWDRTQYKSRQDVREDFTRGKTSQNLKSLNTAINHLNALNDSGKALWGTGTAVGNSALNVGRSLIGSASLDKFKTDINGVSNELGTIMKGLGATDAEIDSWKSIVKPNMTDREITAFVQEATKLMAGRMNAIQNTWQTAMGAPYDFKLISPEAQKILEKLPGGSEVLQQMNLTKGGATPGGAFNWNNYPKAN